MSADLRVLRVDQTWQPVELPSQPGWAPWRGPRQSVDRGAAWLILNLKQRQLSAYVRLPGQEAFRLPGEHHRAAILLPGDPLPVSRPYMAVPPAIAVAADATEPRQINDLLDQLTPLAQRAIDGIVAVPDTEDQDWTARALDAVDLLAQKASPGTYRPGPRYRDAGALFEDEPQLVDPGWADMTDTQLNSVTAALMHTVDDYRRPVRTVGIRAWLYGYRRSARDLQVRVPAQWVR